MRPHYIGAIASVLFLLVDWQIAAQEVIEDSDTISLLQSGIETQRHTLRGSPEDSEASKPSGLQIPKHLILTGPFKTWEECKTAMLWKEEYKNMHGLTEDIKVRYFNDEQCRDYISQHYIDDSLVDHFLSEPRGDFRSDICRTAILLREGGFYKDLDVQLTVSLKDLVDQDTTFFTVKSAVDGYLNALIATTPENPVMEATLKYIRKWYRHEPDVFEGKERLLGPGTMNHAVNEIMKADCPGEGGLQFTCGSQVMRFYAEEVIGFGDCSAWGARICPKNRAESTFSLSKFGLFAYPADSKNYLENPRKSPDDRSDREQYLIGWPRFSGCNEPGCALDPTHLKPW